MSRTKRLPCGHVFHFGCLQSWFERQAICPICRGIVHRCLRSWLLKGVHNMLWNYVSCVSVSQSKYVRSAWGLFLLFARGGYQRAYRSQDTCDRPQVTWNGSSHYLPPDRIILGLFNSWELKRWQRENVTLNGHNWHKPTKVRGLGGGLGLEPWGIWQKNWHGTGLVLGI